MQQFSPKQIYETIIILQSMHHKKMLTEQSREQVVKSNLNYSKSKQLWSFSKKQRFQPIKSQCPNAFYQNQVSTLSNKKSSFPSSIRRIFTQTTQSPLPGKYNIQGLKHSKGIVFAESRDKCLNNSYIPQDHLRNPGPSDYVSTGAGQKKVNKGYSMRPKTPNHRNYFIEDKQKIQVPSPFVYNPITTNKEGKNTNSKLHSTILGWAGLMKKSPRFEDDKNNKNPGPFNYSPNKLETKNKSSGGSIGNALRQTFIDKIRKCGINPGPGNYELPSQFGHYRKIDQINSYKSLKRT